MSADTLAWTSQPGDPDRPRLVVTETHDRIRLSAYVRPDGEWHVSAAGGGADYSYVSTAAFLRGDVDDATRAADALVVRVRRMLAAGAA